MCLTRWCVPGRAAPMRPDFKDRGVTSGLRSMSPISGPAWEVGGEEREQEMGGV